MPTIDHSHADIDKHVGFMLRFRRREVGLSQEKLAEGLQVTFQQCQKYERGLNRISASRLWLACQALDVEPGFFFEGLQAAHAN